MKAQKCYPVIVLAFFCMSGCQITGTCKVGDHESCPSGSVCYGGQEAKTGTKGICKKIEDDPTTSVKSWRLILPVVGEIAPLQWDKRDVVEEEELENAAAGWTGTGPAVVEVELENRKLGEALEVSTGHGREAECSVKSTEGAEGALWELWECKFGSGWNFAGPEKEATETTETVELKLKAGEEEERVRTYRVDVQPPLVGLVVSAGEKCTVGSSGACPEGRSCHGIGGSTVEGAPGFCASPNAVPVRVCAHARDTQSGLQSIHPKPPLASLGFFAPQQLDANWKYDEENGAANPSSACWSGILPIDANLLGLIYFGMELKAWDIAGNLFDSTIHVAEGTIHGSFERSPCIALVEELGVDAVKAPLAFSGSQLLFGTSQGEGATVANNSVYFFDAKKCKLDKSVHTGAVQGPMLAMGESGKVAVALGGGGPAGGPRLAVVDAQGFTGDAANCTPGAGEIYGGAAFDKGLSLVSAGNADGTDDERNVWRFAAPANSEEENASRLVAYAPNVKWQGGQCITNEGLLRAEGRFMLTPMQYLDHPEFKGEIFYSLATIKKTTKKEKGSAEIIGWLFNNLGYFWVPWGPYPLGFNWRTNTYDLAYDLPNPSGMAAGTKSDNHEHIWLSGDGLWNICNLYEGKQILNARWRTSPAVVDGQEQGRAYVVVATDSGYEMQRFSTECTMGDDTCPPREECVGYNGQSGHAAPGICRRKSSSFDERPVGSPLLGEPPAGGQAEIYIVGTTGTVLALDAEELQPLWVQSLGMRVLPTAQPVLVPNSHGGGTLWVVGANGEVRGVRVSSRGLNQSADWPKAFHDNCNTSSSAVKPDNMPSCF